MTLQLLPTAKTRSVQLFGWHQQHILCSKQFHWCNLLGN